MSKGKIIIISGPSGSGKTTLHRRLLFSRRFKGKLIKSISATTRPKRLGEKNGRDYLFLSKKEFLKKKGAGYFLEWKNVFGVLYGTPGRAVEQSLKSGKNVLLCIDVKGAKTVSRKCPQAVRIFVRAPSMTELKKRLLNRGSETKKDLEKRLKGARQELREARNYDYVITNDHLSRAFKKLEAIVRTHI